MKKLSFRFEFNVFEFEWLRSILFSNLRMVFMTLPLFSVAPREHVKLSELLIRWCIKVKEVNLFSDEEELTNYKPWYLVVYSAFSLSKYCNIDEFQGRILSGICTCALVCT